MMPSPLSADRLRWSCDPNVFGVATSADAPLLEGTVGQERALRALKLGIELYAPGYNTFVSGLTGTGRLSTVKRILENINPVCRPAPDRCYVNNFKDRTRPLLLTFPRGRVNAFKRDLSEFRKLLVTMMPRAFESEDFSNRKRALLERYQEQEKKHLKVVETEVEQAGFRLAQVRIGRMLHPDVVFEYEGELKTGDFLDALEKDKKLPPEQIGALRTGFQQSRVKLEAHLRTSRQLARQMMEELETLARTTANTLIEGPLQDFADRYQDAKVAAWLADVKEAVLAELGRLKNADDEASALLSRRLLKRLLRDLDVNVLCETRSEDPCPIIIENTPTYTNVFGTIERTGRAAGHYTNIRAGSLLRADGGYLVLNAADALSEPGVWRAFKRTLKSGCLEIQTFDTFAQMSTVALQPEPIPVNVKVIFIGDSDLYHTLYHVDDDFKKIFKVRADFDDEMPCSRESIQAIASLVRRLSSEEELLPFSKEAMAKLVEYAVRKASFRGKLSSQFSEVADLAREAHFHARRASEHLVSAAEVGKAEAEMRERSSLAQDKLLERIREQVILIATRGTRIGQINGLAVYDLGHFMFGAPSRITATVSVGKAGIINIEREARMSGRTHDKAVLILSAFLRERFARRRPMTVSASLCFEQSYSGVDGDSASAAEIVALLSALAQVPIRQDLAITGSVNQKGDVQPIGGVNEKIEGFFHVCRDHGLTGTQGVLIPEQNVPDLMLAEEVVATARANQFHLYSFRHIEEALLLMTGLVLGEPNAKGHYPEGTLGVIVEQRLRRMERALRSESKRGLGADNGSDQPREVDG
ncbi:MAG: ATP-binding protein [Planctomycetota bacterium]